MAKEGDQKDLICGVTMETIDVEKEDMIRVAARAEVGTESLLCGAGWWWGG